MTSGSIFLQNGLRCLLPPGWRQSDTQNVGGSAYRSPSELQGREPLLETDSRFFRSPRASFPSPSYLLPPEVEAGTRVQFPVVTYMHARRVKATYPLSCYLGSNDVTFTLWSPNSSKDAFLPGRAPAAFMLDNLDAFSPSEEVMSQRPCNGTLHK